MAKIKLALIDFDGVLTNNKVTIHDGGSESVVCDKSDGVGLRMLKDKGIKSIIISSETSNIVGHRAKKLGIDFYQCVVDKLLMLQIIIKAEKVNIDEVAYIGNDVNDLGCMQVVGMPIAVQNATCAVKAVAKHITKASGGDGAVREACEAIVRWNGS